jgi:hypothetical protein
MNHAFWTVVLLCFVLRYHHTVISDQQSLTLYIAASAPSPQQLAHAPLYLGVPGDMLFIRIAHNKGLPSTSNQLPGPTMQDKDWFTTRRPHDNEG